MIVVWRITTRCNLACPFCAYDRTLPFTRTHADPDAVRTFCATLADYQNHTGDRVLVSWLGGEPFLWPELPALTAHATSLGLSVSATTNGTTLRSPEVRQHILDHYAELTVSLDAPNSAHDTLRHWPGAFASLRENITLLSEARRAQHRPLKLRINTVLLRAHIADFPQLAREVATWGINEITFNTLGGRDRPEYFPAHHPTPAQLATFSAALPALRRELTTSGLTIAGTPAYLDRLQSSSRGETRAIANCAPGERFLFINEHASVSPCSFTTDTLSVPLSELTSPDATASLPTRFFQTRTTRPPRVCTDCPSTQVFEKFLPALADAHRFSSDSVSSLPEFPINPLPIPLT